MRIVRTNKELFKYNIVSSTLCDFCGQYPESVRHVFWECEYAQTLWTHLSNTLISLNINIDINFQNISLGIPKLKQHKTPINFILMTAKYFIFKCKCLKETPNINYFRNYLKEKIRVEKHIAQRKGKLDIHNAKWNKFSIFETN